MNHTCRSKFHKFAFAAVLIMALLGVNPRAQAAPNFGPNVYLFSPSTPAATIQSTLNTLFGQQNSASTSQFDANRYAVLFEPGTYNVTINMGYYMQVLGLGQSPDNVTINGALQCFSLGGDSTQNFWMSG